MKIPFIKVPNPDLNYFNELITKSVESGHYTNFGPNEVILTSQLEDLIGYKIVCCANATLALDGLHDILWKIFNNSKIKVGLPSFTFPATSLGCRAKGKIYAPSHSSKEMIGFVNYENLETDYAITTAPFGSPCTKNYFRPNTKIWIIDNAAGATPKMERVSEWLDKGADAVVVSLHATKSLSACEGGFVAFRNQELYDIYKKYINFGFYFKANKKKIAKTGGSNHKMSELSAAWARMSLDKTLKASHLGCLTLASKYKDLCEEKDIRYIYSTQAFWIYHENSKSIIKKLTQKNIEVRLYYTPLEGKIKDKFSVLLSRHGICLPTWNMSDEESDYVFKCLREIL